MLSLIELWTLIFLSINFVNWSLINMNKPNLFRYATKELSQDAFFCWLLEWAQQEYHLEPEYNTAMCLMNMIFQKGKKELPEKIESVKIKKQYKGIDILCIVNDRYAIIIEDKVYSNTHSDQLERYRAIMSSDFKNYEIILIYLKTGVGIEYKHAEQQNYAVINRGELIKILTEYNSKNTILLDFREHIIEMEDKYSSFKNVELNKWTAESWSGFFEFLKGKIENSNWGKYHTGDNQYFHYGWRYVNNSGLEYDSYMEVKSKKLCFRLSFDGYPNDFEYRRKCYDHWKSLISPILDKENIKVVPYTPTTRTRYQTVVQYANDFRISNDTGIIDIERTIELMQKCGSIVENLSNQLKMLAYYDKYHFFFQAII